MVEHIESTHASLSARDLGPSSAQSNPSHRYFLLRTLDGYDIVVNSSHVTGLSV